MSELFPADEQAREISRLNFLWYSALPGGVVIAMLVVYVWMRASDYEPPVIGNAFASYLPLFLGTMLLVGTGLTLFLKSRLPGLVARSPSDQPVQQVTTAMFVVLGVADAPAFIGIAIYLVNPVAWLALAIIFYAFAAGIIFKPDFDSLLSIGKQGAARQP